MKYVLILLVHFNYSMSVTTAVFDDREACEAAGHSGDHGGLLQKDWNNVESRFVCVPQGSKN